MYSLNHGIFHKYMKKCFNFFMAGIMMTEYVNNITSHISMHTKVTWYTKCKTADESVRYINNGVLVYPLFRHGHSNQQFCGHFFFSFWGEFCLNYYRSNMYALSLIFVTIHHTVHVQLWHVFWSHVLALLSGM